jgi:hypothetical protein
MELAPASYERTYINTSGGAIGYRSMVGRLSSQDASSLFQKPSLHTKHQSDTERVCDPTSGIRPNEQSRTGRKSRQANSVCSSCRDDGSRCSSQRPACRCRSGKHLECPSGLSKDTSQRASYKSRVLMRVETGRKASITKTIPLQVRSACTWCQKRKAKCTGERPVCRCCSDRGLDCSWDVADGSTRTSDLKRRLREATNRSLDLDRIFAVLRDGTDVKSTEVLARLRLGDSNAEVILSLTDDRPLNNNNGYQQLESSKGISEAKNKIVLQQGIIEEESRISRKKLVLTRS